MDMLRRRMRFGATRGLLILAVVFVCWVVLRMMLLSPPDATLIPAPVTVLRTLPIEASPLKDACSAARSLTLRGGKWAPRADEPGIVVEPMCLHEVGWSSAPSKCLVEFPASEVRAYTTRGFAAGAASYYYRFKYGGISYYTAQESKHLFLMLDHRWCQWPKSAEGFRLVE